MAFINSTKSNIAYKRVLGKIHTSNEREAFNEPMASKFLIAAQDVWAEAVPETPVPGGTSIVSDLLDLELVPVSGTDNTGIFSAYMLKLGSTVPSSLVGKKNRITGTTFAAYDRVGQIIPIDMGPNYQPLPYEGSTAVYAMDASDWYIDNFAGILTQETDNPSFMRDYTVASSKLQCYVYIGKMITEAFGGLGGGATYNFFDKQSPVVLDGPGGSVITPANGISGDQDGVNRVFTLNAACDSNSEHVYFNGSLMQAGKDYTISGSVITFSDSVEVSTGVYVDRTPEPTDLVQVSYREQA